MEPGAEGEWLGADGWTARGGYSDGPRRLTRRPGAAKVEIFSRDIHAAVHVQLQNKLYACSYDCRINDARQFTEALAHYPESVNSVMMIMAFIFEQMSCYFEGAMGVHCNREVARQMSQRNPV